MSSVAPARGSGLASGAALVVLTAAGCLWANRTLSGDVYWLLAAGRDLVAHGFPTSDPFDTLSHGRAWLDQQWAVGALFYGVVRAAGLPGLSLAYALLLGASVVPLVAGCRGRSPRAVLAAWALFAPTLVAVLDPRAEGFSLLAFSLLTVLVCGDRRRWRVWLIPPLFALWANLHAAFLIGFLLLGLVALGSLVDAGRGVAPATFSRRFAVAGLAVPAVLLTPLGVHVLDYVGALHASRLLPQLTFEWQPTYEHPLLVAYVALVAAYAVRLWWRAPAPRRVEPLLVALGLCLFALTAARQVVWLGPLCFYLLRSLGQPGSFAVPRRAALPLAGAATAALAAWLVLVPGTPPEPQLMTGLATYATAHPPARGRVLAPSGTGSFLLWRSPATPTVVDGRFESYSDAELSGAYALLRGDRRALPLLARWRIGGVITRDRRALAPLEGRGFRVVRRSPVGWYLVRGPLR